MTDDATPSTAPAWHVLGTGSMACLWAANLAASGHEVSLIARDRSRHAAYHGITLESAAGGEHFEPVLETRESATPIAQLLVCTKAYDTLDALRQPLEAHLARLHQVTLTLLGDLMQGKINQGLANSALYLKVFGHAVIGWRWLEQALRATQGLEQGNAADADFYHGKLQAARWFLSCEVPGCEHELRLLETRNTTCLDMQEGWF